MEVLHQDLRISRKISQKRLVGGKPLYAVAAVTDGGDLLPEESGYGCLAR
jgi:hypothetical protein